MRKSLSDIRRLTRFGLVGSAATAIHAGVLWALVEQASMRASLATLFGFLAAFSLSYVGHFYFTFGSSQPHRRALPGFALAAMLGGGLNWVIFLVVVDGLKLNYWWAFLIVIISVPVVVFAVSKRFAFDR